MFFLACVRSVYEFHRPALSRFFIIQKRRKIGKVQVNQEIPDEFEAHRR